MCVCLLSDKSFYTYHFVVIYKNHLYTYHLIIEKMASGGDGTGECAHAWFISTQQVLASRAPQRHPSALLLRCLPARAQRTFVSTQQRTLTSPPATLFPSSADAQRMFISTQQVFGGTAGGTTGSVSSSVGSAFGGGAGADAGVGAGAGAAWPTEPWRQQLCDARLARRSAYARPLALSCSLTSRKVRGCMGAARMRVCSCVCLAEVEQMETRIALWKGLCI